MSLKKTLADAMFIRDEAGRTIVYLWGSKGYFVPDAATEGKLRTIRLWQMGAAFFLGAALIGPVMSLSYGLIYEWPIAVWCIIAAALVLIDVGQRAVARWVTRGLEPASRRMGWVESLQRLREPMPRFWRWYLIASAPIVFLGSAAYLVLVGWEWVAG
jgi:hypothetical protein